MNPQIINNIIQTKKSFGDIPVAYGVLVDLNTDYVYTHLMLINETDETLKLKFSNVSATIELTVESKSILVLDDFKHFGIINYKYASATPTTGFLNHFTW